jgi:hypothetical protein
MGVPMFRICTAALLCSTTVAFISSNDARALTIVQFDKLAISDQGDYVALLLQGAQKILVDAGKGDQAVKLNKLFSDVHPGDQLSIGMLELESNIDNVRLLDAQRYAKDHQAVPLEVEHAMALTLKRNGIELPQSFMHVGDTYKPKLQPSPPPPADTSSGGFGDLIGDGGFIAPPK